MRVGRGIVGVGIVVGLVVGVRTGPPTRAAGISTHFQAAQRARAHIDAERYPELKELLDRYGRIVHRVGADFADWGYIFEETAHLGEAAHWPPFYLGAVDYMKATYPEPWGAHEKRLFAFLAGVASHGIFDDVWHFGETAFLPNAIAQDLPSWPEDTAGGAVELLTDMFVQVEQRAGLDSTGWYVPIDDLVAIYHSIGHTDATAEAIGRGTSLLRVGALLEDTLGWLLYLPARGLLPWTHAEYVGWHDGGLEHGAEMSAREAEVLWDYKEGLDVRSLQLGSSGHPHESVRLLLGVAAELVDQGAIRIPTSTRPYGAIEIGEPEVVDEAAVERALLDLIGELQIPLAP